MSSKHKISTFFGFIGLLFGMYSYFLIEKNNIVLITSLICLSIILSNLFNKN